MIERITEYLLYRTIDNQSSIKLFENKLRQLPSLRNFTIFEEERPDDADYNIQTKISFLEDNVQ